MLILGIETSCDETSAAVVEETGDPLRPWAIRSNVVASQAQIHREWGGVVPELASRQHIRDICGVVERTLDDATDVADVLAGGKLGYHAAPLAVNLKLRCDHVRPDRPRPPVVARLLDNGGRRFVTGGLDTEDQHRCYSFSLKVKSPGTRSSNAPFSDSV